MGSNHHRIFITTLCSSYIKRTLKGFNTSISIHHQKKTTPAGLNKQLNDQPFPRRIRFCGGDGINPIFEAPKGRSRSTYQPINLSQLHHLRWLRRARQPFPRRIRFCGEGGINPIFEAPKGRSRSTILIFAPSERYLCRKRYSSVKLAPAGRHPDGKRDKFQTPNSKIQDPRSKCQISPRGFLWHKIQTPKKIPDLGFSIQRLSITLDALNAVPPIRSSLRRLFYILQQDLPRRYKRHPIPRFLVRLSFFFHAFR